MLFTIPIPYIAIESTTTVASTTMKSDPLVPTWESLLSVPKKVYPPIVAPENQTLKKLKLYKPSLQGENPDSLMLFIRIPASDKKAKEYAEETAITLREYASYGYSPIIIFEPSNNEGGASLGRIARGEFDVSIEKFFQSLKEIHHISEKELGLIVPYPEINTPAFSRKDFYPSDFSTIVNRFFTLARNYYPTLRGSILLEGKTYSGNDWNQGSYSSLKPYIEGINTTFIQSFGIQGFPWMSRDDGAKFFNFRTFLPKSIIDEASSILKTKNIWINTGTIGSMYSINNSISPTDRAQTLNGLLLYLRYLKLKGYRPFVHIFSQNNLVRNDDFTDWSYLQSDAHLKVFGDFIRKAHRASIKVGFYDE